jgi:hypothetical protein
LVTCLAGTQTVRDLALRLPHAPVVLESKDGPPLEEGAAVTPKNPLTPLNKLKDTAVDAVLHPKGTAGKVVEQAKGTAALGRHVVGGVASQVVEQVTSRVRGGSPAPTARGPESTTSPRRSTGETTETTETTARPTTEPPSKAHGDPIAPSGKSASEDTPATTRAPAKKSPAKKSPKKTTAKKAAKAPAETTGGPELVPGPSDEQAAREASPADVAKKVAKKAPAKKTAAKTTKKSPATKAAAKTAGAPGDKLPPRRTASAAELAEGGPDVPTPVGTTGAGAGSNPDTGDTDLQQPGTEGIVEPGTAKSVATEAEQMRRAAETNPE